MPEFRNFDKSSSRKIAKEVCWEVCWEVRSEGRCRPGRWPGSNRPHEGEIAERVRPMRNVARAVLRTLTQNADHRGLSELVPVAFTRSKLMASEGRSPLAGDLVRARSPRVGLIPATEGGRDPNRRQAGSYLQAR